MNEPRLIESKWLIDGVIVTTNHDNTPEPIDETLYNEDGWSIDEVFGCVRNLEVDNHLAILAAGDEFERKVAETAPGFFAVILPGREYDQDTLVTLRRNYQQDNDTAVSGFLGGWMFEPFWPVLDRLPNGKVKPESDALGSTATHVKSNANVIYKDLARRYINELNYRVNVLRTQAANPNAPEPSPRPAG